MTLDIKYPMQMLGFQKRVSGQVQTFSINFVPSKVGKEEMESGRTTPLELHSGFSRFTLDILDGDAGSGYSTVTANIPAISIPTIYRNISEAKIISRVTENVVNKMALLQEKKDTPQANAGNPASALRQKAFGRQFKFGKNNGKCPGQLALEEGNKEGLLSEREFYSKNMEKYENNAKMVEAIDAALKLLEMKAAGQLSETESEAPVQTMGDSSAPICIYPGVWKFSTKKQDKQNPNSFNLCYAVVINYYPGNKYPYEIKISNCYAPVETVPHAGSRIHLKQAVNQITKTYIASAQEFEDKLALAAREVGYFEAGIFPELYQTAYDSSWWGKNSKEKAS